MAAVLEREPVLAPDAEAPAIRQLDAALGQDEAPRLRLVGADGVELPVPSSVVRLLVRLVHDLARGRAVTVVPIHAELTTQQAADLLNVSRPFLIKLLDAGVIPYHRVGTHRRMRFQDLMAYQHQRSQARRDALRQMARDAQELGLYE